MTEKKVKEKKPVYKKWWFWVVIVVVIGIIGSGSQGSKKVDDGTADRTDRIVEEKKEYHIGDTIDVGSYRITVNSVKFGYDAENEYSKPSNGHEFVKVNLTQENLSLSSVSYNALDWEIEDENGASSSYLSGSALGQASDFFGSGDLAAGGKKTGSIVFEIPNGQRKIKVLFNKAWTEKVSILLY